MNKIIVSVLLIALVTGIIIVFGFSKGSKPIKTSISKDTLGFIVMELYTSQGCSSCPPADELLGYYAEKNDRRIIPLAFHVDYWNRLGWVDSFSNSKYTQRQRDYATRLGLESVYTPQLIINGRKEILGSDKKAIEKAIGISLGEPPAVNIAISFRSIEHNILTIGYSVNGEITNSTINAVFVQSNVETFIKAGENRGMKLNNYNVVRELNTVDLSKKEGIISLHVPTWFNPYEYSFVLFVQDNSSGKITGAIQQSL